MRIALLSDIHGNLPALHAVHAALLDAAPDEVVCLGDVAVFGPEPHETVRWLHRQHAWRFVLGNTDAWALNPQPHPWRNAETPLYNEVELWSASQLDAADREFLRSFSPVVRLSMGGSRTLCCYHGSPRSYDDAITAATAPDTLDSWLASEQAGCFAGGHTHTPLLRRHRDALILNPGSVGLPYVEQPGGGWRNPSWAEFALLDCTEKGLAISFMRADYEVSPLLEKAQKSGMPHADWWSRNWG